MGTGTLAVLCDKEPTATANPCLWELLLAEGPVLGLCLSYSLAMSQSCPAMGPAELGPVRPQAHIPVWPQGGAPQPTPLPGWGRGTGPGWQARPCPDVPAMGRALWLPAPGPPLHHNSSSPSAHRHATVSVRFWFGFKFIRSTKLNSVTFILHQAPVRKYLRAKITSVQSNYLKH